MSNPDLARVGAASWRLSIAPAVVEDRGHQMVGGGDVEQIADEAGDVQPALCRFRTEAAGGSRRPRPRCTAAAMCRPSSPVRPPPPPWAVEETDACFIARDAHGQAPAYVYFEGKAGRRGGSPAHVRRCTVLAAMRRYEFCQVFCRGIRAKLRCSLIPFSRLGNIRLNSDSAEPPDKKRIERLSQRDSGSSAACFGGAL
jgi:hypothetical protein